MWPAATAADAFGAAIAGATTYRQHTLRLYGIPESEIAETLRAADAAGPGLDGLEITTCLRRGELEVVTRYEPPAEAAYQAFEAVVRERHADTLFSTDGSTVDEQVAGLLRSRGWTIATAESCTRQGPAVRRSPDGSGGLVGLRAGRPRRVLERSEDGARGRAGGPDRARGGGFGRGRRGAGRRRAERTLGAEVGVGDHRESPARAAGRRREAGRPRLLLGGRAGRSAGSRARRGCRGGARKTSAPVDDGRDAPHPAASAGRDRRRVGASLRGRRVRERSALRRPRATRSRSATRWAPSGAPRRADNFALRAVRDDALHVTLAFLGHRALDDIDPAREGGPQRGRRSGAGTWRSAKPLWLAPRRPNHVLTVEVADTTKARFLALQERVVAGARVVGQVGLRSRTADPLPPARDRRAGAARRRPAPTAGLPDAPSAASFAGDAVTLYRSWLGGGPARYEALERVPLAS